jgi:ERCC4-type nuclease
MNTAMSAAASSSKVDCSIIDLTEEDASSPSSAFPTATATSTVVPAREENEHDDYQSPQHVNMTILIDNRERTRNCKPRYLRTELSRLLASGPLALAWPQNIMPKPAVEERALVHGDFCFELHGQQPLDAGAPVHNGTEETTTTTLIPVCIERKRIADLVQRSASRDHWNQLQRMRDRAVVSIFLLEGDFRIAGTSVMPFSNSPNRDGGGNGEWSANSHVMEDEEGILRFIARAILSTGLVRFIQTKDEQESLRAIAATGLVSATSQRVRQRQRQHKLCGAPFSNTTMTSVRDEQARLSDRLQVGGIPWQLAKAVSQEIGSIPQMDRIYKSGKEKDCQSQLLIPVIQESCGSLQSASSASAWSAAIRQVYFSTLSDVNAGKKAYRAYEHLVTNHAALLEQFHSGERITPEEALDAALSAAPKPDSNRKVSICLPETYLDVLPSTPLGADDDDNVLANQLAGSNQAFYTAVINTALTPLPTIVLQTKDDCYESKPVFLCILEGQDITERLRSAMTTAPKARAISFNGLEAARAVAKKIYEECITSCHASERVIDQQGKQQTPPPPPRQTIVLIVRGLRPALDRLAKAGGQYLAEIRAVMDIVLAEVMISHNVVVLQAIRKTGDLERMVQEFALACFHFQLLTEQKKVTVQ